MHPDAPRSTLNRHHRVRLLQSLEQSIRQFRTRPEIWPLRVPAAPIAFDALATRVLGARVDPFALRSRTLLRLEWPSGDTWELWVIALPSGVLIYCDGDGHETRILASAKRGNPGEADGFFLERLAETRGHLFGIEMAGAVPDRVRSSIGDRDFLADVFVELFEGTEAEPIISAECSVPGAANDFRTAVVIWLDRVLTAPPPGRRQPRLRDQPESL